MSNYFKMPSSKSVVEILVNAIANSMRVQLLLVANGNGNEMRWD